MDDISEDFSFSDDDFRYFRGKIFDLAGISLSHQKFDLVRSRLSSYLRKANVGSLSQFRSLLDRQDSEATQNLINILTTNKTDFFREPVHFDYLRSQLIPAWIKERKRKVRVWCCASSTGEEPYTIAMVLDRHLPRDVDWSVLASDVDTQVLKKAMNGVYPKEKSAEIPPEDVESYLIFGKQKANGWFKFADRIHSRVRFIQHNLISPDLPEDEAFDVIFCRNVMIYFNRETIYDLAEKLHRGIRRDGRLLISHTEALHQRSALFQPIQPAIFSVVKE